jgi:hypothetical protein
MHNCNEAYSLSTTLQVNKTHCTLFTHTCAVYLSSLHVAYRATKVVFSTSAVFRARMPLSCSPSAFVSRCMFSMSARRRFGAAAPVKAQRCREASCVFMDMLRAIASYISDTSVCESPSNCMGTPCRPRKGIRMVRICK